MAHKLHRPTRTSEGPPELFITPHSNEIPMTSDELRRLKDERKSGYREYHRRIQNRYEGRPDLQPPRNEETFEREAAGYRQFLTGWHDVSKCLQNLFDRVKEKDDTGNANVLNEVTAEDRKILKKAFGEENWVERLQNIYFLWHYGTLRLPTVEDNQFNPEYLKHPDSINPHQEYPLHSKSENDQQTQKYWTLEEHEPEESKARSGFRNKLRDLFASKKGEPSNSRR
ncbi:hypothetical protein T439DRAFT_370084 [Meredithblackwellia eburnea MCA 4105]